MNRSLLIVVGIVLWLVGCKPGTPSEYIQPDEMEDILVDYHMAKAMAEYADEEYGNRSYQQALFIEAVMQKHGVTKAARRYHTNRQFVYRQLEKYDGDVRSLALRSRKPHRSPNAHTEEELELIRRMLKRNGVYGLAEVYVRCKAKGYNRSFGSMCRQIRKRGYQKPTIKKKSYTR
jgi:hypothetical protein